MGKTYFTSESVTEGHPYKICDQISDAVLDEILTNDPNGRVACETTITTGMILNHHLRCCNINNFGSNFRLQPVQLS